MKLITRYSSTAIFFEWERPGLRVGFMSMGRGSRFFARALLCPGNESKEGGMSTTAVLKAGMKGSSGLLVGEEHTAPRAGGGRGGEGRRPHRHIPRRGQRRERAARRRHARAHGRERSALRRARAGQGGDGAQPRLSAGRIRTASAGNSCNKKKAAGYTGPPPRGLETLLLTNAYSAVALVLMALPLSYDRQLSWGEGHAL